MVISGHLWSYNRRGDLKCFREQVLILSRLRWSNLEEDDFENKFFINPSQKKSSSFCTPEGFQT
jgi:hypothetical protein